MNLLTVLDQPLLRAILDVLLRGSCTAEQLSRCLSMSKDEIMRALDILSENRIISANSGNAAYSICRGEFDEAARELMRYTQEYDETDDKDFLTDISVDKSLCEHLYAQREENFQHAPFDREVAFYESICSGNIATVKMLSTPLCSKGYGVLSKDPLRNLKYHFAISVAMITRFCINGGMTPEEAYNLSDVFIMRADDCSSEEKVHAIHGEMLVAFTNQMRHIKSSRVYSKPIVQTIDYISEHLHQRIMIQDVADYLSLSVSYLSRLFKLETGMTLSEYINVKKIEAASSMLQYSEYTDLEISNLLCFSSQSYFIKVFKKYSGITPKEYKKRYRFPEWKARI